jgi:hypothetical protein
MTAEQQVPTAMEGAASRSGKPALTVVIPVKDEAGNIRALLDEIARALAALRFEVICVDDGSSDGTAGELDEAKRIYPWLRVLRHRQSCGQSTATLTGVRAAQAEWIVTIDGDGQNPPGEIVKLLQARDAAGGDIAMVAGQREKRHDSWFRRLSSRIANGVRQSLLSCSAGTSSSPCPISTTCTASCRRWSCARAAGSSRRPSSTGPAPMAVRNTAFTTAFGPGWSTSRASYG